MKIPKMRLYYYYKFRHFLDAMAFKVRFASSKPYLLRRGK